MRELNEVDVPWITVHQILAVIRREYADRRKDERTALFDDAMRAADDAIKVRDKN